ncbi:hypothetical protein GC169_08225 [bacterium]|nr:hypothetical protein [bacterium]
MFRAGQTMKMMRDQVMRRLFKARHCNHQASQPPERSFLRRFVADQSGAFAMQFALTVIPLVVCTGLAVDGGRAFLTRYELGQALDAAALAVGSTTERDDALPQIASDYVGRNFRASNVKDLVVNPPIDDNGVLTLSASVTMNTYFMPLVGVTEVPISVISQVRRGGANVEVALVLDTTGSMGGSRIAALKTAANTLINQVVADDQSVYYSKVAIVPYANSVPAGDLAATVRGEVEPDVAITDATWRSGVFKTITNVTKANQAVFTSNGHGYVNDQIVFLNGLNAPYDSLNGVAYKVKSANTNTFKLRKVVGNQWAKTNNLGNYGGGGETESCLTLSCEVQVTAPGHGLTNDEYIWIQDVEGMTNLNVVATSPWRVNSVTADTFVLQGSYGPNYPAYTGDGVVKCLRTGCQFFRYTTKSGGTRTQEISSCVTERIGDEAYTDAGPDIALAGRLYPGTGTSSCFTENELVPLTANKANLIAHINALDTDGYTSGHIGIAWGWYMLSPNWAWIWDNAENAAADYTEQDVIKVAVIMTDGEFNTAHCQGVVGNAFGSGSNSQRINCDATNGSPFTQAETLCEAMRDQGVTIYSVGVELGGGSAAANVLRNCASDPSYFYETDEDDLEAAFSLIARSITRLRLTR